MNKDEATKFLMAKLKEDEDAYRDYANSIRASYLAYCKMVDDKLLRGWRILRGLERAKPMPTAAERLSRATAYVLARLSGEVWHDNLS